MKPESSNSSATGAGPHASSIASKAGSPAEELAEQRDNNLRLAADFENFKRRSLQDNDLRAAAQKESFIHELLPAIDNLERALASGASPGSLELHQGVEMTLRQLRQLLAKHGIETEESVGRPFDPHRQEAIAQRHDPAQADHAILEVFQRGYRRGEKVFRPAKVAVNDLRHSKHAHHAH
jgi:molecular chaperone GrpE